MPELTIIAFITLLAFVPLAVVVWGLVTLFQMRRDQAAMRDTLARIEQSLRK